MPLTLASRGNIVTDIMNAFIKTPPTECAVSKMHIHPALERFLVVEVPAALEIVEISAGHTECLDWGEK